MPSLIGRCGGGGSGIQFNVDNEGGWLKIGSGNSIPFPDPMAPSGIGLMDTNSGGGVGIWDGNLGAGVTLIAGDKAANFWTFGNGGINLFTDATVNVIGVLATTGQTATISTVGDLNLVPDDTVTGAGFLVLANLPLLNPGGAGRVWNNGGVLNIT